LGIPQGLNKAHTQFFNRHGNTPRLEKKPPLLNLADPSNLESEIPAIKAAAEIKQAEDLKPQKIKAIKYLASIGCGCYDKDEKITKALIAAMEDCTEEVRVEAVKAVMEAASGECCVYCSQKNCCNEKVVEQLYKTAYEMDDEGCYLEPSERVRQAAAEALQVCCWAAGGPPDLAPEPLLEGTDEPDMLEAPPDDELREEESAADAPQPPPIAEALLMPPKSRRPAATARLVSSRRRHQQPQDTSGR
jgi:hypothetical protein